MRLHAALRKSRGRYWSRRDVLFDPQPRNEKHGSIFERAGLAVVVSQPVSVKRSPILGYNHNVQYRGLIFHIQTEDSGLRAPHVFTHLFHGGVIVSTRKLVYDAGTVEEGIKALMQSQHKAVMKELRKGTFDAKIDEYLGDTPGLVPVGGEARESVNAGNVNPVPDELGLKNAATAHAADDDALLPPRNTPLDDVPVVAVVTSPSAANLIPAAAAAAVAQRTGTAPLQVPSVPSGPVVQTKSTLIGAGPPGDGARRRPDSVMPLPPTPSDLLATEDLTGSLASFSPTFAGNSTSEIAAPRTYTPARVMQRPAAQRPALTPPDVQTRAMTADDTVSGSEDIVEIHSPAMPSVEPPPGSSEHRSGEYAQHRRRPSSQVAPFANDARSQTQNSREALSALVQSGAGKRTTATMVAHPIVKPPTNPSIQAQRPPTSPSIPVPRSSTSPSIPTPPIPAASHRSPPAIPNAANRERLPSIGQAGLAASPVPATRPATAVPVAAARPRTPTPARVVPVGPGVPRRRASTGAGVVMSKPAVVVGTPSRNSPVYQGQSRVRSAREGENPVVQPRAISERSLDEVILAYLSEDSKNQT